MADWTLAATWSAELSLVRDRIADINEKISISDGSLKLDYLATYKMLVQEEARLLSGERERSTNADGSSAVVSQTKRGGFDA